MLAAIRKEYAGRFAAQFIFFNSDCVWWGYPHCMYKFHVQNAMTRNMVVVDEKHPNVADSRLRGE